MNQFKKYEPWANLVYFVMLTIAGNAGLNTARIAHTYDGEGFYIFLMVLYWILILPAAAFKIYKTLEETGMLNKMAANAAARQNMAQQQQNFAQPQQQSFAQPNMTNTMPQQTNIPTPAPTQAIPQPAAAGKVCPNCGASVPADSQFCVNCGTKV